jgi:hypothetical protein
MRSPVCYVAIALALASAPAPAQAQKKAAPVAKGYDAVQGAAAYDYTKTLASPELGGRFTAHKSGTDAARWIAAQFKKWGLKPLAGAEGYLQAFPTEVTYVERAEMTLTTPAAEKGGAPTSTALELNRDFLPLFYTDSGTHGGPVVFTGWCVSAPELNYDDYAGVDIKGKWAACFRGVPDRADARFAPYDEHRLRMKTARDKGALGIIYIYDQPIANPNGDWQAGFTPVIVSYKVADQFLKEKGTTADALRADLLKYKRPISFETHASAQVNVRSTHQPNGTGYNVVGVIEGSDPILKNEYVVVGGHMDHCGPLAAGYYPGANDNATGTAVAMEIGRAMMLLDRKPKRSVVIALFGAEEMGLKGSEYFVAHLPTGLGKPVAMVNFDMVGEGDGADCAYSAEPPAVKQILNEANATAKALRVSAPLQSSDGGSDFVPFVRNGIPSISCSSNGPHLAYHQLGDTIYRINPDVLGDIARLGYLAAFKLADQ